MDIMDPTANQIYKIMHPVNQEMRQQAKTKTSIIELQEEIEQLKEKVARLEERLSRAERVTGPQQRIGGKP